MNASVKAELLTISSEVYLCVAFSVHCYFDSLHTVQHFTESHGCTSQPTYTLFVLVVCNDSVVFFDVIMINVLSNKECVHIFFA